LLWDFPLRPIGQKNGSKLMSDGKSNQENQFDLEALKESIERMKPEL
jgi:hypothetical protein